MSAVPSVLIDCLIVITASLSVLPGICYPRLFKDVALEARLGGCIVSEVYDGVS